jgi:hypothetical protein
VALPLRILLDTNILIPFQDSLVALRPNLPHVHQLCNGRHELLYHPASRRDIQRDIERIDSTRAALTRDQTARWPVVHECSFDLSGVWPGYTFVNVTGKISPRLRRRSFSGERDALCRWLANVSGERIGRQLPHHELFGHNRTRSRSASNKL